MLGSAVSSSTPRDFQSSSHMGLLGSCPLMRRHAPAGRTMGCPYIAVGMQSAFDSAIGLPRRSTRASRMLAFLMPAEVRRSFMVLHYTEPFGALKETTPAAAESGDGASSVMPASCSPTP